MNITEKKCLRCGWTWLPRADGRPALCPHCGAAKWDEIKGKNEPGAKRIHNPPKSQVQRNRKTGRMERVNG